MSEVLREAVSWAEQNRAYLAAELSLLGERLGSGAAGEEACSGASCADGSCSCDPGSVGSCTNDLGFSAQGADLQGSAGGDPGAGIEDPSLEELRAAMVAPPAVDRLERLFGLSPFERSILLLCAGVELDGELATRCAAAQGSDSPAPTFGLALAHLPDPHWSALSPGGPLRSWRLVELEDGGLLTRRPLRIDERILHFLVGVQHLDERLQPLVVRVPEAQDLVPSHLALAESLAGAFHQASREESLPAMQLLGSDATAKLQVAAAASAALGLELVSLRASAVPTAPVEIEALIRLWRREALLAGRSLFLDCDDLEDGESPLARAVARFVDDLGGVLFVSCRKRRRMRYRSLTTFEVEKPTTEEQHRLWRSALGPRGSELNGQLDSLVGQFRLEATALRTAARRAVATLRDEAPEPEALGAALWTACRRQARPRLDHLAQRIDSRVGWEDLVLAPEQKEALRDLAIQVRQRTTVHERWGFAAKSSRGLGIAALFAGVSGTGKTLAAEVLANELDLDLYRIDLAAVISKYLGETDKNLGQVFDAAEGGGVVLLFDEADALFGKRSEVKDSHDRYANVEISYLLQRMESYQGLAILTTNMKSALDNAFLRRLRFVVEFAFPGPEERAEIWRRIFPPETPTEGVDVSKLARLNVAGGNIRSIALGAAFAAADEGCPVGMEQLLRAARAEYRKLEKPLNEVEIRGWLP